MMMMTIATTAATATSLAFQLSTRSHWNRSKSLSPSTERQNHQPSYTKKSNQRRLQLVEEIEHHNNDDDEEEEDTETIDDFFVSPEQISFLRKEASKRDARNQLPRYNLSMTSERQQEDDEENLSDETIASISNLFEQSELIEVRGVSKNNKRRVHETAYSLASTLETVYETPVVVVEIKGFAAKLYRPWSFGSVDVGGNIIMREGKIQLRSNYKPGQWTRKAKPIRDERGQIVTDEFGKSVKEVPKD